jgi:hypothetical protein
MFAGAFIVFSILCGQMPAEFEIRTLHDKPQVAAMQSIGADGTINLNGDLTIASGEWYSLRRVPGTLPDWPRAPHVELTNGDRIRGTIVSSDGDAVRLLLPIPGPEQIIRLPLSALRVAWLTRRPVDDPAWLVAPRKRDVIQSRNGDLTLGALSGIEGERKLIRYQADGKDQQLPLSRIAAIGFNNDLARARRPKGQFYRLTLADGTRLSATNVNGDGTTWTAQTLFKDTVRISWVNLVSIDVEQAKAIWLSDLKPAAYQYHSYDGEQFTWAADRCVTGDALRLKTAAGESTFDRGIGLHAECTIAYSLAGKYKWFEALAGLDAKTGIKGDAIIAVLVDGKEQELKKKGLLTLTGGPIAINLDVTGVKELKIAVKRANAGNVQDHVNLAEARLVP